MIITITDRNSVVTAFTIDESAYTTKRESFERKGVSVDYFDGSVKQLEFGKIWKCKVSHESSESDDFSDLLTALNNADLITVVAEYFTGEVILETASWQNEKEAEGIISEDSWEFEMRSVAVVGSAPDIDTVTIKDGSASVSLKGVEINESLDFTVLKNTDLNGSIHQSVKFIYAVLEVKFELSATFESIALNVISSWAKNHTLKANFEGAKYFTSANDLTVVMSEIPDIVAKRFYGLPGHSYSFKFIAKITPAELGNDITEL